MKKMNKFNMKFTDLLRRPLASLDELQRSKLCLDSIEFDKGDTVCEIGCGSGTTSFFLSDHCQEVAAIDISGPLIDFLISQPHADNLEFYVMDATQEPPVGLHNKFDKLICIDVMEHVEDTSGLLYFISKVLKVGGTGVITFPINNLNHGRNYFTKDSVVDMIARSDLNLETTLRILNTDRFGLIMEKLFVKTQTILAKPPREGDRFEEYTCFQMLQKPRKIHAFYKFAISLLFKLHENPYYDCESGDRALLVLQKK